MQKVFLVTKVRKPQHQQLHNDAELTVRGALVR